MTELQTSADVQLVVPATAAHLRHVRVLAATVADDCGFDVEAIESWRIAVDELCALAMGDATEDAQLSVTIMATDGGVELSGRCGPVTDEPTVDPIALQLLRAGSDDHDLRTDGDTCRFELHATRRGTTDDRR